MKGVYGTCSEDKDNIHDRPMPQFQKNYQNPLMAKFLIVLLLYALSERFLMKRPALEGLATFGRVSFTTYIKF